MEVNRIRRSLTGSSLCWEGDIHGELDGLWVNVDGEKGATSSGSKWMKGKMLCVLTRRNYKYPTNPPRSSLGNLVTKH